MESSPSEHRNIHIKRSFTDIFKRHSVKIGETARIKYSQPTTISQDADVQLSLFYKEKIFIQTKVVIDKRAHLLSDDESFHYQNVVRVFILFSRSSGQIKRVSHNLQYSNFHTLNLVFL